MNRKLTLNTRDKKIAGVCAGLADYLEIDVILVRIIFLFFAFQFGGGLLLYIIMWALMPKDPVMIEKGVDEQ
ncbi:MAG: PspC domain-containing protein [Bacteroidales bacterium]|nr:PspC domain-containing protein [Bacteroidales bacterium]